jgi:hypothetical protein
MVNYKQYNKYTVDYHYQDYRKIIIVFYFKLLKQMFNKSYQKRIHYKKCNYY